MPASLRDVRVVSPAVNLPGPLAAALLIAGCGFAGQYATRNALKSAGLGVDDIGLCKVNETFADVPLIAGGEFGIPNDELNVNDGFIAVGHPLGSVGARVLTDPRCEPERSQSRNGLQAICGSTAPSAPPSSHASKEHLS